jgi:ligand-binding sensor protein
MELTDIMSLERWKSIADQIHEKFGFNGTVFKKDNNVLVKSDGWANKVCPAIKSGESVFVCSSAQQRLFRTAQEKKDCVVDECDAGFIKFLMPLYIGSEFAGMIGGCGYLAENTKIDAFYISKLLKKEDITDLLSSTKYITKDKLMEVIQFVQGQAQTIVAL